MGKSISEVLTALTLCGANYRADSCMLVPSETAGMLLDHGRIVQWIDGGLLITGRASRIFVRHCRYRADDPQQDAINFLSGKRWW